MNVMARRRVGCSSAPKASGTKNNASVAATTHTEYHCSTLSMNSWVFALVADASSTIDTIRAMTVSCAARVTRTRSAPVPLRVPANTSSPAVLATGNGSPVIEAWSTSLVPSTTSPSTPMRSPGRTSRTSPISAVLAGSSPETRSRTEFAVRRVATASSAPETAKITISSPPSNTCPIAAAPIAATTISRSTSRVFPRSARNPSSSGAQPPAR